MNLNAYMSSPGFGVYGEEYMPEIVEITEEDLAPMDARAGWVIPSQFSHYGNFGSTLGKVKGTVLGVGAGIIAGLAASKFKDEIKHPIIKTAITPASASIATLAIYWLAS